MDYQLITYAGPPVLGAFIGYLTNKVAIRMLFRPLKAWRVCGIRVPMTPGVIPSKRHQLAENIGEMVGEHLLTSKDIGAALAEERFQNHLFRLVDKRVNDMLLRDLGPVITLVPDRFKSYFKIAVRTLKYRLREGINYYLNSAEFAEVASGALTEHLKSFGETELNQLVSSQERQNIYDLIDNFIAELFQGQQLEEWLTGYLLHSLQSSADNGKCIADHLPQTFIELVETTIRERTPAILQSLARMLSEPEIREQIILVLKNGIEGFVASLGPLGAMVGNFLDMSILEEKIRDYLAGKEDDIAAWLQNQAVQKKMAEVLLEQVNKFLHTPIAQLIEQTEGKTLQSVCNETAIQLLGALNSQGVKAALSEMFRHNLEVMFEDGRKPVSAVISGLLPIQTSLTLKKTINDEVLAIIRSEQVGKLMGKMLRSMVDGLLKLPVGALHDLIPAGIRQGITEYIVGTANEMLHDEVPGIIESLDIRQTVTQKVDSLDLKKLERLLLSIMEEQFKYINLFGALLGFLIGLLNLLVIQLG